MSSFDFRAVLGKLDGVNLDRVLYHPRAFSVNQLKMMM
jgi:hypothetical protein